MKVTLVSMGLICYPDQEPDNHVAVEIMAGQGGHVCSFEDYHRRHRQAIVGILATYGVEVLPRRTPVFTVDTAEPYTATRKVREVVAPLNPDGILFWFHKESADPTDDQDYEELYFFEAEPGGPLRLHPSYLQDERHLRHRNTVVERLMATGLCASAVWHDEDSHRYVLITLAPAAATDPVASMTALVAAYPTEDELV